MGGATDWIPMDPTSYETAPIDRLANEVLMLQSEAYAAEHRSRSYVKPYPPSRERSQLVKSILYGTGVATAATTLGVAITPATTVVQAVPIYAVLAGFGAVAAAGEVVGIVRQQRRGRSVANNREHVVELEQRRDSSRQALEQCAEVFARRSDLDVAPSSPEFLNEVANAAKTAARTPVPERPVSLDKGAVRGGPELI